MNTKEQEKIQEEILQADEEIIENLYAEFALANKVYEYIIKDINPEISDDEARTITVQYIQLKGDRRELFCTKCNKTIPYDNSITGEKVLVHSDLEDTNCSGKVQPTVPHYNSKVPRETWNNILYSIFDEESLKNNKYVPNTHALILVGVDIGEDIVGDLIDTYKVSRGKNNLQHLLIAITYKSPQLIDMLEAEFGTADEIDESLLRLKELLKK